MPRGAKRGVWEELLTSLVARAFNKGCVAKGTVGPYHRSESFFFP